jgi:sphingolipid 4-desaturase/C4-monooxygenase
MKVLWLALFPLMQIARTYRYSKNISNSWMVANYVGNLGLLAALTWLAGDLRPFVFLLVASLASIGLHPVGARWLAEHYALSPGQETYSYYGPLNHVAFNIGYHNEHHDMPDVPCSRLPRVRATAPEFYDHLYAHPSYLGVLKHFFTDKNFTLRTRVVRSSVPVTAPVA